MRLFTIPLYLRFSLLLSFASLCLTSANVAASDKPALFTAVYEGKHSGLNIKLTRELQQSDNGWRLSANASNFLGYIRELSEFSIENGAIKPERYVYERKVFGKKSKQSIDFDWQAQLAHYRRSDKKHKNKDFALVEGTLDPSLYQLKLQQELAAGKNTFKLVFAKDSRVKDLQFEVIGPGEYKLNGTSYQSVELQRINQPDKKQSFITLLPELNYQIAQIRHIEEDGSSYTVKLTSYQADNQAVQDFYKQITK
ncbi:DUF3108 domain-containing protein [Agaribacterium haliotis]|uniref:DUF3108 domain-containing protein n=1 Tax=Agaribacterium haliotis TaxID=2013869 RepID=UPI0013047638|nr:DUF3108 domain-containing protein [Agaribacterium haliotis]